MLDPHVWVVAMHPVVTPGCWAPQEWGEALRREVWERRRVFSKRVVENEDVRNPRRSALRDRPTSEAGPRPALIVRLDAAGAHE